MLSRNKKSNKVLIVSARGFGNVGDDLVSMISGALFNTILNGQAEIKFADLSFRQDEVAWADIVVLGGGGILYDSSFENVENYLRFIDHARLMGKKTVALGVGTQGINTEYGRRRYRETLSSLDLLIVRDLKDADTLAEVGVSRPIYATTDVAFLLPELLDDMRTLYSYNESQALKTVRETKAGLTKKQQLIMVSLATESLQVNVSKDQDKVDYKKRYKAQVDFIGRLQKNAVYKVVLVCQSEDDRQLYEDIVKKYPNISMVTFNGGTDALDILDIYRLADIVITSRYHGFIAALLAGCSVYVVDGANSGKTIKAIQSHVPSVLPRIISADRLSSLADTDLSEELGVNQADDVNTTIVKARQTRMYLESLLDGYISRK